jgi:hypothetical protein
MSRRAHRVAALALAALATLSTQALAQNYGFTLFGGGDAEGKALTPERKAVHPITAPYFQEDSSVTTDVRLWYAYHSFPESIALNGGHANVYAAQIRVALTDQLQLVAYKDGYTDLDSGLIQESGWNDLAAGLKWNFVQDYKDDLYLAVGAGYQFAVGDAKVLQNDQEARLWFSINKGFGPLHLGGTVNYLIATGDEDALGNSDRLFWHLHADYFVNKYFSPVVEASGFHVVNEGDNKPLPFSGADVLTLGGGDDVIVGAVGFEVRPLPDKADLAFRVAYETAIAGEKDLYGYRWTFSAVYTLPN